MVDVRNFQWPANVEGKVIGWGTDGKFLENKEVATPADLDGKQDVSISLTALSGTTKEANDYLGVIPNAVTNFGAVSTAVAGRTGAMTVADNTFTDANAAFVAGDVGKNIYVESSHSSDAGYRLATTIASITSATEVELTDPWGGTENTANCTYVYGADSNGTALGTAADSGQLFYIPPNTMGSAVTTPSAGILPDPTIPWTMLTNNGAMSLHRGHVTNSTNGVNIYRLEDRVFVGEAASKWAATTLGIKDSGTSWFGDPDNSPTYLGIGAALLVTTHENLESGLRIAGCFAARASDSTGGALSLATHVENERSSASGASWAFYIEAFHLAGAGNWTYAAEIEVRNSSGVDNIPTAYGFTPPGAMGLWIAASGHSDYGPASTNPCASAVTIGRNGGTASWNKGLVFVFNGLTGTDGSSGSATFGTAIEMGRNHKIAWAVPPSGGEGASIVSMVTAATERVYQEFRDDAIFFRGVNAQPILHISYTASTQNYMQISSNAASAHPKITATGTSTNVDFRAGGKGTGGGRLEDGASTVKVQWDTTGVGFFGAAPVARPTWGTPTGTGTRTTFDTTTVTLPQLAERVHAMIVDLESYGLFA